MKREFPEGTRRVVSPKKKFAIIGVFLACVLILILYKIPTGEAYVGVLQLDAASVGENTVLAYGDQINVKITLTVQNNVLFTTGTSGTVRINDRVFRLADNGRLSIQGKLAEWSAPDEMKLYSYDDVGGVRFPRCVVHLKNGKIKAVTLRDGAGNPAGTYK